MLRNSFKDQFTVYLIIILSERCSSYTDTCNLVKRQSAYLDKLIEKAFFK